jgi:hypothetical protein
MAELVRLGHSRLTRLRDLPYANIGMLLVLRLRYCYDNFEIDNSKRDRQL